MDTRKFLGELMEGEEKDVNASELARAIGISKTYLSGFFNGKNELTFHCWVRIIQFLKPEREDELISTITETLLLEGDSTLNTKALMEYYSTHRKFSQLETLINSLDVKGGKTELRDFAKIYRIALQFQQRSASNEELLFQIEAFRSGSADAQIFANILRAYALYTLGEYKTVFRIGNSLDAQIAKIGNPLLRSSYNARISEIMARGYLYLKNDTKKARFFANNVIKSNYLGEEFKVGMYHLLGTSYLFENYEESIKWFTFNRDTLERLGRYDIADEVNEGDIFFAKVLWNKDVKETDSHDRLELAHYYARQGDIEKVEELCEKYPQDNPFVLFYKGIASNNPELLLKSQAKFIETGDKLFAQMPLRELANHPAFIVSANVINDIQIA